MKQELFDLHSMLDVHYFKEFPHGRLHYRYCDCGVLEYHGEKNGNWKPSKYNNPKMRVNHCKLYWELCETAKRFGIKMERGPKPASVIRAEIEARKIAELAAKEFAV